LQSAGYEYVNPTGAFYIFCKSPIEDDVEFVKHLQKYNILAVPGSGFAGAGYFRLCFCTSEKTILGSAAAFKKALEEI
jgi:aspartate aminotransferase